MIAVYYDSGKAQWKYELENAEYDHIIKNVLQDYSDLTEAFDESLEILRDLAVIDDEEMDEDDEFDQMVAVAFLWHYFNTLCDEADRIEGDIVIIESEDGTDVTVMPASAVDIEKE